MRDAAEITSLVSEIRSVNFGGLRLKDGATLISKAIAISDDDVKIIKGLLDKGMELEIRQVPTDSKQMVENLI